MALVINDRVRETTQVVGTGSATLLGAVTGYQSFSTIGNGNTTYYTIADQGGPNWEVGIGTWATGGTLARTTVLSSSNSGSLVNFTAGTKDVFVTQPSEKAVYLNGSNNVTLPAGLTATSLTDSGLTSGRVTYATTGGLLTDSANLTFDGSTLTTLNSAYTGTLTGGTGIVNLGSGQFYKDGSGNIGIGVTPSAWFSSSNQYQAIQFKDGWTSVANDDGNGTAIFGSNFYASGNTIYKYINSNFATMYQQNLPSGQHRWYVAPSGTAGNTISFTQAMTLDASGNVGIGTSSPAAPLDVNGKIYSRTGGLYSDSFNSYSGGATTFGNGSSYSAFYVGATERMRIDSSGNVGIGTATPQAKLHANSANNATSLFLTPNSGSSAGDYTQLGFGNSAASATVYGGIRTAFVNPAVTSSVSMQFWTDSGSSTYAERMRITQSGGVSIGTTTDAGNTNLLVAGSITASNITNSALGASSVVYTSTGGLLASNSALLSVNASIGAFGIDQPSPIIPLHVGYLAQTMPSGADIACRNSIAAGAGFICKPNSYGAFSPHAFSIDFTGPSNLWIDYTNVGAFTLVSDYRLKENVLAIPNGALARVLQLNPVQFNRKKIEMFPGSTDIEEGFIADQLQLIIPSGISGSKDELTEKGTIQPQSVNFGPIVAVLTKAIQELSEKFDAYVASHP